MRRKTRMIRTSRDAVDVSPMSSQLLVVCQMQNPSDVHTMMASNIASQSAK